MEMIIIMVAMLGMFVLMQRQSHKRKKAVVEMRNSIEVGDEITTIGGIIGKVVSVKEDFITIETSEDRVRVRLARWAVSTKGKATEEQEEKVEAE